MKILLLHGPNLNLLGTRQPEIYGHETLQDLVDLAQEKATELGATLDHQQSNHEGVLIEAIHDAKAKYDAIIFNAGAYTHTSIALHDALASVAIPCLELHLSDIKSREPFRKKSFIEPQSFATIMGLGAKGYPMAVEKTLAHLRARKDA